MAGADRMYDALFRQVGVIRAQTFSDLIDIPAALEREIRDAVAHVARHGWCAASWQPEVVAMSTPLRLGHHPAPDAAGQISNTRPGFRMPFGSSARLTVRISASSAGVREWPRYGFLCIPMPCSADTLPSNRFTSA